MTTSLSTAAATSPSTRGSFPATPPPVHQPARRPPVSCSMSMRLERSTADSGWKHRGGSSCLSSRALSNNLTTNSTPSNGRHLISCRSSSGSSPNATTCASAQCHQPVGCIEPAATPAASPTRGLWESPAGSRGSAELGSLAKLGPSVSSPA